MADFNGFQPSALKFAATARGAGLVGFARQGLDQRKKPSRTFALDVAINGKLFWDLDKDGPLNINAAGVVVVTPLGAFVTRAKLWGTGGQDRNGANPGAGGFAGGSFQLPINVAYNLLVDQGGGGAAQYGGRGGGYSGIRRVSDGKSVLIAGGGGSDGYGASPATSGAGGGSVGQNGTADTSGNDRGYGGSQSAGGSGGGAGGGLYAASGSWGSAYQGGGGGYSGGAGGGGYFGGGGGAGSDYAGASGGGGSGYFDPALVLDGQLIGGSGSTPGNATDPDRKTAGNPNLGLGRVLLF
ncbi:hypothetical protein JKL49_20850 [Phenylobacterium sp. 20VBR1]|uniref:Uncharacterized protein n=1 Tax=Phenylobacterium glaciei TaxID=2803784 RepID=A0A941D6Y1_9CAUL|nr:hypothetical protein [Phenylobacterium glaciei]MBR7621853.1 hypothetical protein [Phenylobacterium glaciei]